MVRDIRYYENRVALLESRTSRENNSVIRKIKRKMRNLKKKENK